MVKTLAAGVAALWLWGCSGPPTILAPAPSNASPTTAAADPLPSWNDGPARRALIDFVRAASVIKGDMKGMLASGGKGLATPLLTTHTGMTIEEFDAIVRQWIDTARHPTTKRPYTQMVFQPMLEVLAYLRANGFKTFVVSGGGTEFMRPWMEQAYGIPPEQVVGTRGKLEYEARDGKPAILKLPEPELVDDGPGKPVGIAQMIGRRPIAAFGNSDGDFEMLEYVTSGAGRRLGMIVHHTDADREWAYDRGSHIGRLERGLDEAPKRGWVLVDMRQDWKVIHPGPQAR